MADEKHKEYFEGILQLRRPKKEVVDAIKESVNKKQGVFISKEIEVRNGIDFYFSSQRFLQGLGKKLQNNFGGVLKTSAKLHTRDRQKSKNLYRVNVLIELPEFSKSDVIFIDEKIIKVHKIGKLFKGVDLKTNKVVSFDYHNKKPEVLKKYKTQVTKVYPELEVLHPETFQSVKVGNRKKLKIGEKVDVVLKEGIWIV